MLHGGKHFIATQPDVNRIGQMMLEESKQERKKKQEKFLRRLWSACFGDSEAYEDFYFQTVYPRNQVYTIEEQGMLHLNPYSCRFGRGTGELHYIVGVATKEGCRRQGIMRRLLVLALQDMYAQAEPFTYLMPADAKYYAPFSFVMVSSEDKEKMQGSACRDRDMIFADYRRLKEMLSGEEWETLFHWMEEWLAGRFHVYAKHDRAYFDLLCAEKECQEGAVVFCFQREQKASQTPVPGQFLGFFAYGRDGENAVVEQYVLPKKDAASARQMIKMLVSYYFEETQTVTVIHHFPYMLRIVHALSCMTAFADCFLEFALENQAVQLTDAIVPENNGIYLFAMEDGQVTIRKQETAGLTKNSVPWHGETVCMTIGELAEYIFCQKEEDAVFFAEVV